MTWDGPDRRSATRKESELEGEELRAAVAMGKLVMRGYLRHPAKRPTLSELLKDHKTLSTIVGGISLLLVSAALTTSCSVYYMLRRMPPTTVDRVVSHIESAADDKAALERRMTLGDDLSRRLTDTVQQLGQTVAGIQATQQEQARAQAVINAGQAEINRRNADLITELIRERRASLR